MPSTPEGIDPNLKLEIAAQDDEIVGFYNFKVHGMAFGLGPERAAVVESMTEAEMLDDIARTYDLSADQLRRVQIQVLADVTGVEVGLADGREA